MTWYRRLVQGALRIDCWQGGSAYGIRHTVVLVGNICREAYRQRTGVDSAPPSDRFRSPLGRQGVPSMPSATVAGHRTNGILFVLTSESYDKMAGIPLYSSPTHDRRRPKEDRTYTEPTWYDSLAGVMGGGLKCIEFAFCMHPLLKWWAMSNRYNSLLLS
jgi:hypothetical protein